MSKTEPTHTHTHNYNLSGKKTRRGRKRSSSQHKTLICIERLPAKNVHGPYREAQQCAWTQKTVKETHPLVPKLPALKYSIWKFHSCQLELPCAAKLAPQCTTREPAAYCARSTCTQFMRIQIAYIYIYAIYIYINIYIYVCVCVCVRTYV